MGEVGDRRKVSPGRLPQPAESNAQVLGELIAAHVVGGRVDPRCDVPAIRRPIWAGLPAKWNRPSTAPGVACLTRKRCRRIRRLGLSDVVGDGSQPARRVQCHVSISRARWRLRSPRAAAGDPRAGGPRLQEAGGDGPCSAPAGSARSRELSSRPTATGQLGGESSSQVALKAQ